MLKSIPFNTNQQKIFLGKWKSCGDVDMACAGAGRALASRSSGKWDLKSEGFRGKSFGFPMKHSSFGDCFRFLGFHRDCRLSAPGCCFRFFGSNAGKRGVLRVKGNKLMLRLLVCQRFALQWRLAQFETGWSNRPVRRSLDCLLLCHKHVEVEGSPRSFWLICAVPRGQWPPYICPRPFDEDHPSGPKPT